GQPAQLPLRIRPKSLRTSDGGRPHARFARVPLVSIELLRLRPRFASARQSRAYLGTFFAKNLEPFAGSAASPRCTQTTRRSPIPSNQRSWARAPQARLAGLPRAKCAAFRANYQRYQRAPSAPRIKKPMIQIARATSAIQSR